MLEEVTDYNEDIIDSVRFQENQGQHFAYVSFYL